MSWEQSKKAKSIIKVLLSCGACDIWMDYNLTYEEKVYEMVGYGMGERGMIPHSRIDVIQTRRTDVPCEFTFLKIK